MAQPLLFYGRRGLTEDILQRLRAAARVSIAVKNGSTVALGLWVEDELNVVLIDATPLLLTPAPPAPLGAGHASNRSTPRQRHR